MYSFKIIKHRAYVFYPFFIEEIPTTRKANFENFSLQQIFDPCAPLLKINSETLTDLRKKNEWDKEPFWKVLKETNFSRDFYPHIKDILGGFTSLSGKTDDLDSSFTGLAPLELNQNIAKTLLNGRYGKSGPGLKMKLSNAALKRLDIKCIADMVDLGLMKDSDLKRLGINSGTDLKTESIRKEVSAHIPVMIENLKLFVFATGACFLVTEVIFKKFDSTDSPPADLIIEGINEFCRGEKQTPEFLWGTYEKRLNKAGDTQICQMGKEPFRLDHFFKKLIDVTIANIFSKRVLVKTDKVISWNRQFSHMVFQIDDHSCENKELMMFLGKTGTKQTSDYQNCLENIKQHTYHPFENLTHFFDIEGGSSAVVLSSQCPIAESNKITTEERIPKFFKEFIVDTFEKSYLPLLLVAYHEYLALLQMTQGTNVFLPVETNLSKKDSGKLKRLRELQKRLLNFRLNFRFSNASKIAMHNQFFNHWRKVFSLNELLVEVTQDVKEAEMVLSFELDKQQERNLSKYGGLAASLIFLTGFFGMNIDEISKGLCFKSPFFLIVVAAVLATVWIFNMIKFKP